MKLAMIQRLDAEQAADVLREAGYQVKLTPPDVNFPDGGLFKPDLVQIDEQGTLIFVEVERDTDKNIGQRQSKWRNFHQASDGKIFVVCDNRSCMRNICSEINYFLSVPFESCWQRRGWVSTPR